ncbi:hypothetical protein Tco_1474548 [Tanacetum coccineum]
MMVPEADQYSSYDADSVMGLENFLSFDPSECRKAHLLEDKQILSLGIFDEVLEKHLDEIHVTLARFEEEMKAKDKFQLCDYHSNAFTQCAKKNEAVEVNPNHRWRGDDIRAITRRC